MGAGAGAVEEIERDAEERLGVRVGERGRMENEDVAAKWEGGARYDLEGEKAKEERG